MAWQFLKSLGLKKLLLFINSIGCQECRPKYLEVLRGYFSNHINELCPDCRMRLERNVLRLLDCKQPGCQQVANQAPKSIDYLGILEIPFEVNQRLVRGLDYYTRTVFEIQPEQEKSQSTIVGGGRYDGLIETLGGKPTPGIGFGTGIERIILNLKKENIPISSIPAPKVFIACLGDAARNEAMKLTATLRRQGIGVISATSAKSLKAQMRQANNLKISRVIIIGEDEVKAGTAMLKDMTTSQQETVNMADLPGLLK